MTTKDAARIAKCSIKTIQSAVQRKKLKATKPSRDLVIEIEDLREWIANSPHKAGRQRKGSQ